jgi:uncharacterized membrane protein YphA (DoxX/SURF4 family)
MLEAKLLSKKGTPKAYGWRWWLPRLLAGALGLIFLVSALSKATDLGLFVRQMRAYGIMSNHLLLTACAWGLITLEFGLGIGLLIYYRPRLILSLTAMLMLVFLAATSWASFNGVAEECGCFGAWLKRTPKEAVIENLILLTIAVLARLGYGHSQARQSRAKIWTVASAFLIGALLPLAFGFSLQRISESQSKGIGVDISQLEIEGVQGIDLNNIPYLLAGMDLDCGHCLELVEALNALAEEPEIPSVIGLCINEENRRRRFMEEFEPAFPIGKISEDDFWRLLADADLPRILYIRDGRIRQAWDQTVPDKEAIKSEKTLK